MSIIQSKEMEIIKEKEDEIRVVVKDRDITIPMLLTNKMWEYKDTKFAGYHKEHPLVDRIEIVLKGKDIKKVVKKALKDLKTQFEEIKKAF